VLEKNLRQLIVPSIMEFKMSSNFARLYI